MVAVNDFKAYFDAIKSKIPAITRFELVIREDQIANIVKSLKATDILLVVVYPSADADGLSEDIVYDVNSSLLYVLKSSQRGGDTPSVLLSRMSDTQQVMEQVKIMMLDDMFTDKYPNILQRLSINSMHTDPEYDFLGGDGWSLMFNFKTDYF